MFKLKKNIFIQDGIGFITQFDNSTTVLNHSYQSAVNTSVAGKIDHLPFKDNSFDLVVSNLSLHWENQLPEILKEVSFSFFQFTKKI